MRESLRDRLIRRIGDMEKRVEQLRKNIIFYKDNDDFDNAMKNDIKCRQLKMIIQELNGLID